MKTIEQLREEIIASKEDLAVRRRVFLAECEREFEMLMKMDRWLDNIEKEQKRREAQHGED